jgi:protein tyrosine phosphatase (PTP) superfamily phosphohydrolase (DUF442 family)
MSKHLALLLLLLALPPSCQVVTNDEPPPDVSHRSIFAADLGHMRNVSGDGAVWIGSYPTVEDLDLALRRGIRFAIDLSMPDEAAGYDVASACSEHNIAYLAMRVDDKKEIGDARVDRVLAELRAHARQPMLLFCGDGSRAAMLFAIHRAVQEHVSLDQALVEARRAGMKPGQPEQFVRAQVARLLEHS